MAPSDDSPASAPLNLSSALSNPARLDVLRGYHVMDTAAEADFDDVAKLAAQVCGASNAFITFVDDRQQFFKANVGDSGSEPERYAALEAGFCSRTVSSAAPLVITDTAADPMHAQNPATVKAGVRFYAGTPLVTPSGQVVGTLCVIDRVPRQISDEQLSALAILGRQVVALLELRREIVARGASESRLRSVVSSASDYAIISVTSEGVIDGWSEGAVQTFGWTEAEAVGQSFDLVWTDEDRKVGRPARELTVAKETGMCPDNRFHIRSDGRRVFVVGACRPVRNDAGQLAGFVKVCRDETEARATSEQLTDARRRLDFALLAGEVGTFTWDIGGDQLSGDANFARIFGLTTQAAAAFPLASYLKAIHPDDREMVRAKIGQTVTEGALYEVEYRILHQDGSTRWVVARGRIERDEAGRPIRFPGVILDLTARRAIEESLRKERELLRTVFEQAPDDAILIMDSDRVLTAWNPAAERIMGWTAAEAVGQTADIIFTPEDRANFVPRQETKKAAANGKTADERWHIRKDGSRFWGSGTMNALHAADGAVRGYLKVFRDATERQRAEALLTATANQRDTLVELQRAVSAAASAAPLENDVETEAAVLKVAAEKVLDVLPQATGSAIEMLDPAGEELVYQAAGGALSGAVGQRVHLRTSLSGRCIDQGRPLVSDDSETDERVDAAACRQVGVRSMIVVPIQRAGKIIGVLKLASGSAAAFAEPDVMIAQLAVGAVLTGLSGAAEARALEALRRSEAGFRQLADAMPAIVQSTENFA